MSGFVTHWVKRGKEINGDDPLYDPMLAQTGVSFADALLAKMPEGLMGDEPELAVHLQWMIAKHVHDPHDWDDVATVADLIMWRRNGGSAVS